MATQKPVTIKDIAQQLKLSISTVSRALRGGTEMKPETKDAILELAKTLNYSPDPVALSLKEKKSKIIGVIVPEIANNFCSAVIAGIEDIGYKKGYHVMIFQSHEQYERELMNIKLLASRRIDGLIISLSNETNKYDHLHEIMAKGIPVVMFDRVCDEIKTHKVVINDYKAAFDATEHLLTQGFSNIAHVTAANFLSITKNRLEGYKAALKKHGIPFRQDLVLHSGFELNEMRTSFTSLLKAQKIDAILASTERLTLHCLEILKEMNLRIPEDVALIGFSDSPLNKLLSPSLSAVRQPTFELGQKSMELLLELIDKEPETFVTIEMETMLEARRSTEL